MPTSVEVAFRGIPVDPAIESFVRRKVAGFDHVARRVTSCRVVLEQSHRRHRTGNLYRVRVDVTLPGREIVVERDPQDDHAHESLQVAITDAFAAARRQVEDSELVRHGRVKTHARMPRGRVLRLVHAENFGFLESADGEEIYFHRHAVRGGGFEALEPGSIVRYVREEGDEGPQAAVVRPSRRRVPLHA